jgi:hypothetical protein
MIFLNGLLKHLKALPLWAYVCASVFNKLHASYTTFPFFGLWQHLIAQNVAELFSINSVISDLNKACHINELSRGLILGSLILMAFGLVYRKLGKKFCFDSVWLFYSTSMTLAVAGAIQHRHSHHGGI